MTTQIPNSMLLSPSGVTGVTRVAGTPAIPLDLTGNGRGMPLVAGQTISLIADYTPTIGTGATLDGVCVADYMSSGTGNLLLTNFITRGDTFAAEAGRMYSVTYFKRTTGTFAILMKGDLYDVIPPTFISVSVATATPSTVDLVFSEALNATWSAFGAFTVSGHTVTAITRLTATTGNLTVTPAFVNGEAARTLGYTAPGTNNMQDLAGNLLANITTTPITNNVITVPGQVTGLTAGAATSTTQPLTWTAPTSNGGAALFDYLIEYKLAAAGTYTTFSHISSTVTAIVVTGLTAATSYNYRVSAINSVGTGLASAVVTNSTAAATATAYVIEDLFNNRVIAPGGAINIVGTRSDGGAWTVTGGVSWDVNSTTAGTASGPSGRIHANAGHPDTIAEVVGSIQGFPLISVRATDGAGTGACAVYFSQPNGAQIYNSAGTLIGSNATAITVGIHTYRVEVTGSAIVAKIDGVTSCSGVLAGADLTGTFVSWGASSNTNPPDTISRFRAT